MSKTNQEDIQRINQLEDQLYTYCTINESKLVSGFTIMFDDENGINIRYVKDSDIHVNKTDYHKELLLRNIQRSKHGKIESKYSGFISGGITGWFPISTSNILRLLKENGYSTDVFKESFLRGIQERT